MKPFRSLLGILVVMCAVLALPIRAAEPARAQPSSTRALVRFLLVSARFPEMYIEIDGRRVVAEQSNTFSSYIDLASDRSHSFALYGIEQGAPTQLLHKTDSYTLAPGFVGMSLWDDAGIETRAEDVRAQIPANKSALVPIFVGLKPPPQLRFGATMLSGGSNFNGLVNAQTASLELRTPGGTLAQSQYLRAQPGYHYDIVVARPVNSDQYKMIVSARSPQLLVRPTPTRMYKETGHLLEGRFQQYWDQTGGLPVFGFPLNDDHLERTPEGQFVTQVFERNRFEYHGENKAPYDVLLGRLGDESLRQQGRDWRNEYQLRPIERNCEATTVDGRQVAVCEPFLTYYRTHGLEFDGNPGFSAAESLALFGLPLTQAKLETNSSGDRVQTQYFERARFEYHPRNPAGQQVLLGRLGAEVYGLQPLTFDDEDRGFTRQSEAGVADWQEAEGGFGGHYWWTCAERASFVTWSGPALEGTYEVQVFVPSNHAYSEKAPYTVRIGHDEGFVVPLNQRPYSNEWVRLADTQPGYGVRVSLSSKTGEGGNCAHQLAADAIRLIPLPGPR